MRRTACTRKTSRGPSTRSALRIGAAREAAALVEQLGHQRGPAGLVAGAQPGAGVAVEVLVEEDLLAPVRIALEQLGLAVDRAAAVRPRQEEAREARGELVGDLPERALLAGAGRAFHQEV